MTDLLRADALTVRIGRTTLLHNASLTLESGRTTIVVGPNGAGKSTLLKLLSGEVRPSGGAVVFDGRPLQAIPAWRLACARAVLPQSAQLFLPLRVHQLAELGLDGIGRALTPQDRDAILDHALTAAGIADLAGRMVHTLSGGEHQRAHFARVLCQLGAGRSTEPRQILFLDEPTASLDLGHQLALLETACGLARAGTAVFAVIHDLNLAAAFADQLIVLDRGTIVAAGRPIDVLTDHILSRVFGLDLRIGSLPDPSVPFVLPRRRAG